MSNRKALCVGINLFKNYPGSTLHGCVNDANQMVGILEKYLGFVAGDIRIKFMRCAAKRNHRINWS